MKYDLKNCEVVLKSYGRITKKGGDTQMLEKLEKRIIKLEKENELLFNIASGLTYDLFKAQEKLEHLEGNLGYFQGEIDQLFD